MSDSEGGTPNARLRAELVEQGRRIVREEIQPVVERLSAAEKSVGDVREKLGEVAATTRNQWYLLGAVFVGVITVFFSVSNSKQGETKTQTEVTPESLKKSVGPLQPGVLCGGDPTGIAFR